MSTINNTSIFQNNENNNKNLYTFLATNYDISSLAKEIVAAKSARLNVLNLRSNTKMSVGALH